MIHHFYYTTEAPRYSINTWRCLMLVLNARINYFAFGMMFNDRMFNPWVVGLSRHLESHQLSITYLYIVSINCSLTQSCNTLLKPQRESFAHPTLVTINIGWYYLKRNIKGTYSKVDSILLFANKRRRTLWCDRHQFNVSQHKVLALFTVIRHAWGT